MKGCRTAVLQETSAVGLNVVLIQVPAIPVDPNLSQHRVSITSQSQHSHSTVTAQSQRSHSTVTEGESGATSNCRLRSAYDGHGHRAKKN